MGNGKPARDLFQFVTHFWSKVSRGGPDECWPWTGLISTGGYGTANWQTRLFGAHRVAYTLTHGAPPIDKVVMHACDNRVCCNPAHLRVGTVADNNRDRSVKGRTARPGVGNWNPNVKRNPAIGSKSSRAKLTEESVARIKAMCAERRLTQKQIGALFGVSQSTVMTINTGRNWKHVRTHST